VLVLLTVLVLLPRRARIDDPRSGALPLSPSALCKIRGSFRPIRIDVTSSPIGLGALLLRILHRCRGQDGQQHGQYLRMVLLKKMDDVGTFEESGDVAGRDRETDQLAGSS
jgi:hypothetical protein